MVNKQTEANMETESEYVYAELARKQAEADRKAYPVRWLIVAVSVIAAFVFSVITILILDNFRTLKAEGRI